MGEIKQANFRISVENADRFRAFCEQEGLNQAQGFDHLMQVLELDKAKTVIPSRAMEIEEFERHMKALLSAFLNSIEIADNTEERLKEQMQSQLDSKDQTIIGLQKELETKSNELKELEFAVEGLQERMEMVQKSAREISHSEKKLMESLKDKEEINNMLVSKLNVAEKKLSDYEALKQSERKLKEELREVQEKIKENTINAEREQERVAVNYEKQLMEIQLEKEKTIAALEKSHREEIQKIYEKLNA